MRNNNRNTFTNYSQEYRDILKKRNLKRLIQYATPTLETISEEDYDSIFFVTHIWKTGDKLYKLANTYYNEPKMWWIIALFNEKPTEFHFNVGDEILIPTPLNEVLSLIEYN